MRSLTTAVVGGLLLLASAQSNAQSSAWRFAHYGSQASMNYRNSNASMNLHFYCHRSWEELQALGPARYGGSFGWHPNTSSSYEVNFTINQLMSVIWHIKANLEYITDGGVYWLNVPGTEFRMEVSTAGFGEALAEFGAACQEL